MSAQTHKYFNGKQYVFSSIHDSITSAKFDVKSWREHKFPARVWKDPKSKKYIVYVMFGRKRRI